MKKETKWEPLRLFKVSHQILCITGINFDNKSLVGYTELTVWPLKPELTSIRINCKQCAVYKVSIDKKHEAEFTYFDPILDVCQGNAIKRNVEYFQRCQASALNSVDADKGNGELIINIPTDVLPTVAALASFQVCVEFAIQDPQCGLHFVVPDMEGTMAERSAHMYTCVTENFSRLWFPCVDSFSEPCTWKIEVTVDREMTAVACGDLVGVEYTDDMTEKVFHYFMSSPTAAPNVALAVGPFEILVDPKMHEVTHFCLPKLMPVLKHTTSYIHQAFEFYEELMSSRYPYSYYKQVFVDEAYAEVMTYSTMSILSTNLLHPPNIIDQTMASRQLMATAVAQQFFGSFIAMQSWSDAWLTKGITGYLSYMFCKRTFGNNEYRNWVMRDMQEVSEYEQQVGYVILDSSRRDSNHPFSTRLPHTLSPRYSEIFAKKARLVMRMLEIRIGTELFLQVLNKLLSLAYNASQQAFTLNSWANMLVSTSSFLKIIYTVTGKDIEPFIEQWVYQGGVTRFSGNFVFNRKRNVVELEIKQDMNGLGVLKFVGALNVTIQELDGSFNHTFKIEENKTKFEITCHSKSRRNKKKKIPLMTGEEVDMDLSAMDQDSPVLWLRLDPDMHLLRTVSFEQPDYMWQYQLRFERCIVAQFEAIEALGRFPTPASRYALTDTIENEESYYRVRQDACYCLAKVANLMVGSWTGPPAMITIFRKMFGSHSCPFILRQNNFSNFHHYYLLKSMAQAMARLRDTHSLCLPEISKFLLDLFKYNDNSRNKWSDNYFRAALVEALSASITPAVTNVSLITGQVATAATLTGDMKLIVEEVVRALNLEKLMPCYRFTVTCSCLYAIRTLQKYGHLPNDSDVFKDYAQPGLFRDVRVAAITCLVDFIKGDISGSHLQWILNFIENDKDPYLRHHAVTCLTQNPPFRMSERTALNIEPLVEQLWTLMSTKLTLDNRLRCGIADLYFTLYGRQRPTCLPVPETVKQALKEKKAKEESGLQVDTQDSGFASQPQTEWNSDLASMFQGVPTEPVSTAPADAAVTGVEDVAATSDLKLESKPSTVTVNLDMDSQSPEREVDLTMISGEQTVAMEESVVTETVVSDLEVKQEELEVKPSLDTESDVDVSMTEVPHDPHSGPTSRRDSISRLSEESLSPRGKEPPDDVIVSLDNIIRTDPSMPQDIFSPSSSSPPPAAEETEVKEEIEEEEGVRERLSSPSPLQSPVRRASTTDLSVGGSISPSPTPQPAQRMPLRRSSRTGSNVSGQGRLASRSSSQASLSQAEVKTEDMEVDDVKPEVKEEEEEEDELVIESADESTHKTSYSPQQQQQELPTPPRPPSAEPMTTDTEPALTFKSSPPPTVHHSPQPASPKHEPQFSPPPQHQSSPPPPPPPQQSPSPPPSPQQPSPPPPSSPWQPSPPLRQPSPREPSPPPPPPPPKPTVSSGPPLQWHEIKQEVKKEEPVSIITASTLPSSPLKMTFSTARLVDPDSIGASGYPSLKTTIKTTGLVTAEIKDRDRSSHHKSKKKKKKNKHKHKHKHKHDRGDREHGESSEHRPRERLVLDMSELSRASASSSFTTENLGGESSSDMEV